MNLIKTLKTGALILGAVYATSALAESGFKVPLHYTLELADGIESPENYSRFSRTITLNPGRHQLVLLFKDTFSNSSDARLIQSGSPIVIDIMNLKPDQMMTFEYAIPTSISQADTYSRTQKITITDIDGNTIPKSDASYFIMTSENGFVLGRDYRQELMSLDRLYAPDYVEGSKRGIGMTSYGAPTIEATNNRFDTSRQTMTLDDPGVSAAQQSGLSTSSKNTAASAAYKSLVKAYESADDSVKLKLAKYLMSDSKSSLSGAAGKLAGMYEAADDATKLKFFKFVMAN